MALCDKPCCNAEARARIAAEQDALHAQRLAEFEAYLAARAAGSATEPETTDDENDLSYDEAIAKVPNIAR